MRRAGNFLGFAVMIVGIGLLLNNLGLIDLSWDRIWPIFPLLLGISFLFQFVQHHDKGILIPATICTGVGLFFFAFTTRMLQWGDMGNWWPIFPLLVGLGFLFAYLADVRDTGLLIPATILLTVGGVFLAQNNDLTRSYLKYWPVLLVVAGLFMFLGNLLPVKERRPSKEGPTEEPKES